MCVILIPLGFPVEPDVYIIYARLSPKTGIFKFSSLKLSREISLILIIFSVILGICLSVIMNFELLLLII